MISKSICQYKYNRDVPDQDSDGGPDQTALDATFNISNRDIEEDSEPQEE